ncbi:hypothetical protein BB561_004323 [Smittium simulii]|uniref:Dynein heavy chain, cytoplasmic n=1 Tax=Smittium simulii TaxID=133385 RepID=A0A2T9YGX0_9FUNG|nr:hypothetical protein BB561_004323 [Smittium simulii]
MDSQMAEFTENSILASEVNSLDSSPALFDPNILKKYILNLTPSLLGDDGSDDPIISMFVSPDSTDKCRQFASDSQIPVLYVVKLREEEQQAELDSFEGLIETIYYSIQLELTWSNNLMGAIAFIKTASTLSPFSPLSQQLQVINLPGPALKKSAAVDQVVTETGSQPSLQPPHTSDKLTSPEAQAYDLDSQTPYEALHSLIHYGVAPYFNSFIEARQKATKSFSENKVLSIKRDLKDSDTGLPMAKKRLAEFELALLQLQQNTEIPDPDLVINSIVKKEIEQSRLEHRRATVNSLDPAFLSDVSFLNRIQADVNGWIKEIQKITRLSRDPSTRSASQEINFWLNLERSLEKIEQHLNSEEVLLTLDILKSAKRFHATVSFMADTGLKETIDLVSKYNLLMRDLPINDLLAATDINRVSESIISIFNHINKKFKITPYPVKRALPLVEMISSDFKVQLLKILGGRKLMYLDIKNFNILISGAESVFESWDENLKDFVNVARDVTRKRSDKFIPIKIVSAHTLLQERLASVAKFRRQHEQLYQTIEKVMKFDSAQNFNSSNPSTNSNINFRTSDPLDEIREAYEDVRRIDVLDVSREGDAEWEQTQAIYNERITRIENNIISNLHDCLGLCKNASEIPKIRGAIQEYQTQLITSAKEDIRRLYEKFTKHFHNTSAYKMSQLRDIPPVSSTIIWTKEIERKLDHYMKKVEAVLGQGWELYSEGQRLKSDFENFRQKLDTRPLYDAWYFKISRSNLSVTGRVFIISRQRATNQNLQLAVQFDAQLITLFKEVRQMLWLGFQIPHTLVNVARDGRRVYPFAVSLGESIRVYNQTLFILKNNPSILILAAGYRNDIQKLIEKGFHLKWDLFVNTLDISTTSGVINREQRHVTFVRDLASVSSKFQESVEFLVDINNKINSLVNDLLKCNYNHGTLSGLLISIQNLIDKLSLANVTNLEQWVQDLDERIEAILNVRVEHSLKEWVTEFLRNSNREESWDTSNRFNTKKLLNSISFDEKASTTNTTNLQVDIPVIRPQIHELRISNQVMYVDPPLETARASWVKQLHEYLSVVCLLQRPQSSNYRSEINSMNIKLLVKDNELNGGSGGLDAFFGVEIPTDGSVRLRLPRSNTYKDILPRLPNNIVSETYTAIETRVSEASKYVDTWLQYQALWDLNIDKITELLGEDLELWQNILFEIKKARSTFDNKHTSKQIGAHLIIDYGQVQSKVNAKYDFWQSEILNRFGSKLGVAISEKYEEILKARKELEQYSSDAANTSQTVAFITFMEDIKRKFEIWKNFVENISKNGQKILERQRYQFSADWIYHDRILGEWSAFNEILNNKSKIIQEQLAGLQLKISTEHKTVITKIENLQEDWEKSKPTEGNINPKDALDIISQYEIKMSNLISENEQVNKAKAALGLSHSDQNYLSSSFEELCDLKTVWFSLSSIWTSIDSLKDLTWASIVPRKLRSQLDELQSTSKSMPDKIRQYSAFAYMLNYLQGLSKHIPIISDLKSDALRDRHWRQLFKNLGVPFKSQTELSLGYIWSLDINKNEAAIREIIVSAQGEMGLEEFLKQVKETWISYALDLILYQNRCRLIKGWDDLFSKCSEQLSALGSMKISPYYKVFEEEALSWEDKLTRIHMLFDVWVDVQRQWVYLEGIFNGSADIKHLLPIETSRFQNINTEFLAVMKRVYKSPYVLDVLNLPNIQRSLERLSDLLSKIQKALGEYLERERTSFPRFYFVGDEDLLEIIGNSKDIVRIQKHLSKMFSGIGSLQLDSSLSTITGMVSQQGEAVSFVRQITISEGSKINEWLTSVEKEMQNTLADLMSDAVAQSDFILPSNLSIDDNGLDKWIDKFPAQLIVVASQIKWTNLIETSLSGSNQKADLSNTLKSVEVTLQHLADKVLTNLSFISRKKMENLITELVHQRDLTRDLIECNISDKNCFSWIKQMRFYYLPEPNNNLDRLQIKVANSTFMYGFEYLGVTDRLVQTPLTDSCFITLTQALSSRLGGSPFGPAGTGKTESVKALGAQLGRFVLVFCCDETFDFQALGRIFTGLCLLGAYGCFDEFNRLEERILSAVSQQIQSIQLGLKQIGNLITDNVAAKKSISVELIGRTVELHSDTGIFITMNPDYAGRSNLPDNLKKLFRSICMTKPDHQLIAQVMLYSQGFRYAELMASKIVPLFKLCSEQLSTQPHYDFGLRALKSVLVTAGNIKRSQILLFNNDLDVDVATELSILIQSVRESVLPKLIASDIPLLLSLLQDLFPGVQYNPSTNSELRTAIEEVCKDKQFVTSLNWVEKIIQLYHIQKTSHGIMIVGPSGSGKTSAWRVLLLALEKMSIKANIPNQPIEKTESVYYLIDPKAVSKDNLYGTLDLTTREWTDGLFTQILRKIIDNDRGESMKRHWIVFDGDVDPEWVENLNSVLDDNKMLTLPNGERLSLPSNVRIVFEVETLKYATPATVSRCGMVWFNDSIIDFNMLAEHYLLTMESLPIDKSEELDTSYHMKSENASSIITQKHASLVFRNYFKPNGLIENAIQFAFQFNHIMTFTMTRAFNTLFSLLNNAVRKVMEFTSQNMELDGQSEVIQHFLECKLLISLLWSLTGDLPLKDRIEFSKFIYNSTTIKLPIINSLESNESLFDFDVEFKGGSCCWVPWSSHVPTVDIETHRIPDPDVIIPTTDTLRHESILYSWLAEHKSLLLCGPPGSGKTMTLFAALRKLPDLEVVGLNFSAATTSELIIKTFEQYCEYKRVPTGVVLSPAILGRWLVIFCDEINLPATDKYGTQQVITFMRQLIEHGGFWRTSDQQWVNLERIQFVGACNPPTDPGRVPLSLRFLRHVPLVMVDYPGEQSLKQIYGSFSRALLKVQPNLRTYADPLTSSMVEVYLSSQRKFTSDIQAHYIYSPRELTRWVRGIYESVRSLDDINVESLVRIWAHEGLRLFQDRLVDASEKKWTDDLINNVSLKNFPTIDHKLALERPILFSNWLSRNYIPVDRIELREHVKARLKVFYDEELDVSLVLFNDVLDHVLRIDRIMRQPQGHALLVGVSGSGKTTLTRFVAWMNGLSVFQVKAHSRYTAADFDEDLRIVLRRAGTRGERICFIFDESNVLQPSFLERMNTLLANSEIPGLFEADEFSSLLTACRDSASKSGLMLDSPEELYKWFTQQVSYNLHVVFTMNPPSDGLSSRVSTSPALFNRCVLDWFGDWNDQALYQVGTEFTLTLDLDNQNYDAPETLELYYNQIPSNPTYRMVIANAFVAIHKSLFEVNNVLSRNTGKVNFCTPRHYLDFIQHYIRLFNDRQTDLEEQQRHLNVGLDKLNSTVQQVKELRISLAEKKGQLEQKTVEANNKLKQMVEDQNAAEKSKEQSIQIQTELEAKNIEIEKRRKIALEDLEKAEPAVIEAKQAVSGINRAMLTEVRTMANPPLPVKLAMESACTLLGHKQTDWRTLQGIIRKDDFITSIMNFDTESRMNRQLCDKMKQAYLNRPDYNFESINRASRACGPLAKWVIAQVNYASILERVEPLRNEVKSLEEAASVTKNRAFEIEQKIINLENSIARYKDEYAVLISETQQLKAEMEKVSSKVERSVKLIDSLSSERTRWDHTSSTFADQMSTIAGDVLISAAYLAYAGYFDQEYREQLLEKWVYHLMDSGITFKENINVSNYLVSTETRLKWQQEGLHSDDLEIENAIMLENYNRFPLIIDPSGHSLAFLQNNLASKEPNRKLTITSFLDDAFLKHLESSLRFGNPIVIQDAEHVDPILNPILNRELRKTGGRVLIRLGSQDIDYSPAFSLYLFTRDSSALFSPDLSSRVTFVNFTATSASLQSQCLNEVLINERPDVEKRRTDLIRLQSEFKLRLHSLEKELLQALSSVQGNILDNDSVIETLERLKNEASVVSTKVAESENVMQEINQQNRLEILIRDLFWLAFNKAAAGILHKDHICVLLELSLIRVQSMYDMESFWTNNSDNNSITASIEPNATLGSADKYSRLNQLSNAIVDLQFLLSGSTDTFSMASTEQLREVSGFMSQLEQHNMLGLIPNQELFIMSLNSYACNLPWFKDLLSKFNSIEWFDLLHKLITSEVPENFVPEQFINSEGSKLCIVSITLRNLVIINLIRPDRIISASTRFISCLFNPNATNQTLLSPYTDTLNTEKLSLEDCDFDINFDLNKIISEDSSSIQPIVLCSIPGYDASFQVEALASKLRTQIISVAMGSVEGLSLADKAVDSGLKTGKWVLIKNVHLAPSWLGQLEKRLSQFSNGSKEFRLFITMEISPKVPKSFLRRSRTLLYEPTPGLRANVTQLLQSAYSVEPEKALPAERTRIQFLLSWLHATLTQRLAHVPLGWTKTYEFSDADFACAISTTDDWLKLSSNGRANLSPDRIPWEAIRFLLTNYVYGGQLDNEFDKSVLSSFVDHLFQEKSFSIGFELISLPIDTQTQLDSKDKQLIAPDAVSSTEFIHWSLTLPDNEHPLWLGLPQNANIGLLEQLGKSAILNARKLQALASNKNDSSQFEKPHLGSRNTASRIQHDNNNDHAADISSDTTTPELPAFAATMSTFCEKWLAEIPQSILEKDITDYENKNSKSPLLYTFIREYNTGRNLLKIIHKDLEELFLACIGKIKLTNYLRNLINDFSLSSVPSHWLQAYSSPSKIQISEWLSDFILRLNHLAITIYPAIVNYKDGELLMNQLDSIIWLGGLFYVEAFITATQQETAKNLSCSLEELTIKLDMYSQPPEPSTIKIGMNVKLSGIKLQGASLVSKATTIGDDLNLNSNTITLNNGILEKIDSCILYWVKNSNILTDLKKNEHKLTSTNALVSEANLQKQLSLPLYLNLERNILLFEVDILSSTPLENTSLFLQRGVALLAA